MMFQEYKPPTAQDIPVDLRVTILPNSKNSSGVVGSKGKYNICNTCHTKWYNYRAI